LIIIYVNIFLGKMLILIDKKKSKSNRSNSFPSISKRNKVLLRSFFLNM
jgi:hypothetical protein